MQDLYLSVTNSLVFVVDLSKSIQSLRTASINPTGIARRRRKCLKKLFAATPLMESDRQILELKTGKKRRIGPSNDIMETSKRWSPLLLQAKNESIASPPTRLCHVDRYALHHILSFLETRHIILLLFTGNVTFNESIKSRIDTFSYVESLPLFVDQNDTNYYKIQWPSLLLKPLFVLRSLVIHGLDAEWQNVDMSRLPKTLTRLSLKESRFLIKDTSSLPIDLPNLSHLSIVRVEVRSHEQEALIAFDGWVSLLLAKSAALSHFNYHDNRDPNPSGTEIVRSLPKSLQVLKACGLLLSKIDFSQFQHLHTLTWLSHPHFGNYELPYWPDSFVLPTSLTRLHLYHFACSEQLYKLLSLAPSSLLHLSSDSLGCKERLANYSRFTQLQSLIPYSSFKSLDVQDYSLLPPSLTELSNMFGKVASKWPALPQKVRLVGPKHKTDEDYGYHDKIWSDISFSLDHASRPELSQHFPTNLFGVELHNVAPPNPFVGLQRATIKISKSILNPEPVESFDRLVSAVACPTLTELNIEIDDTLYFVYMSDFKVALPNLVRLSMDWVQGHQNYISPIEMSEWLRAVPKSVQHLKLELSGFIFKQPDEDDVLEWRDGLLGPNLVSFELVVNSHFVEFPRCLPPSLVDCKVYCHGFAPHLDDHNLHNLPRSLKRMTLSAMDDSIDISKEAIERFEQPFSTIKRRSLNILLGSCRV